MKPVNYTISGSFICLLLFSSMATAFDYLQALPDKVPVPVGNPLTVAKAELGKKLYFDPRLSLDGSLSCNSCHNIFSGGDDGRSFSIGFEGEKTSRSAPSLLNIGFKTVLYWDGRTKNLEDQTREHILDKSITGITNESVLIARLSAIPDYQKSFKLAFNQNPEINLTSISAAIASFERTLTTPDSRFDRYIKGDKTSLTDQEKRGMEEFRLMGCIACHFGVDFSGPAPGPALKMGDGFYELFPNNLGSKYDTLYNLLEDMGIYNLTKNPRDKYLWRVPSLRNITLTAPYFHNGSVPTLKEAITVMGKTQYNNDLSEQQVNDIEAFLKTLTGRQPEISTPVLPEAAGRTVLDLY